MSELNINSPKSNDINPSKGIVFNIVKQNLSNFVYDKLANLKVTNYKPGDQAIATSLIGTPVYSNLFIQSGSTQDPTNGRIVNYPSLRIDSAIMQVEGGKDYIKTEIQGRDGSVKEFISNKDYQINVTGFLISSVPNLTPVEEKNSLISISNAKTSISIVSSFLIDFGIYNMVIDTFRVEEKQGYRNIIPFSMTCTSDLPYDLEIEQENQ